MTTSLLGAREVIDGLGLSFAMVWSAEASAWRSGAAFPQIKLVLW